MHKKLIADLVTLIHNIDDENEIIEKTSKNLHKLKVDKLVERYKKIMEPVEESLLEKNPSIFDSPLYALPQIDMSRLYRDASKKQKAKLLDILHKLYITEEAQEEPNISQYKTKIDPADLDLFKGVGVNGVGIQDMSRNMEKMEKDPFRMPGSSIAGMLGDKMDKITQEDIDEATQMAEKLFSGGDPKSAKFMRSLIGDITSELQQITNSGGNPMENVVKIAQKVADRAKPRVEKDGIDMENIMQSTKNAAADMLKEVDPTGAMLGQNIEMIKSMVPDSKLDELLNQAVQDMDIGMEHSEDD